MQTLLSKTAGDLFVVGWGLNTEPDPAQTASMEDFLNELNQVRRIRPTQGNFLSVI